MCRSTGLTDGCLLHLRVSRAGPTAGPAERSPRRHRAQERRYPQPAEGDLRVEPTREATPTRARLRVVSDYFHVPLHTQKDEKWDASTCLWCISLRYSIRTQYTFRGLVKGLCMHCFNLYCEMSRVRACQRIQFERTELLLERRYRKQSGAPHVERRQVIIALRCYKHSRYAVYHRLAKMNGSLTGLVCTRVCPCFRAFGAVSPSFLKLLTKS